MSTQTEKINELLGIDDSYKAPEALMSILYSRQRREKLFRDFLPLFNYDVNFDWFHEYFQDEHADRKNKKQDFTPKSVATLLSALVGESNNTYEACAGTGGITISKWHHDRLQTNPFDYCPSDYLYVCEELSDRAIPFLLFNLLLRGMNAIVVHCDVLSREAKGVFFIQNDFDDHLKFSSLNLMPYTETIENEFSVKFTENKYDPIRESEEIPAHLITRLTGERKKQGMTFKEAFAPLLGGHQ